MAKKRKIPDYSYHAIFRTDNPEEVFDGMDDGIWTAGRGRGFTMAWHRGNYDGSPYCIWNEMICASIGQFLRLPIPPFAMTHFRNRERKKQWLFSSLDFNYARAELPEIIPENCVAHLEPLCAGVLAFDILIANEDRHAGNLLVDDVTTPRAMYVYDHDQALFGGCLTVGPERFTKLAGRLGVTGSNTTRGNKHVFLPLITEPASLREWCGRITDIPDWFIDDVCQAAKKYGLRKKDADSAAFFLRERKRKIMDLVESSRDSFAIKSWGQGRLFVS